MSIDKYYNMCYNNNQKGDETLKGYSTREVIRLLQADGWFLKNIEGSHSQYIHPTKKGKVTVVLNKERIPPGTLNSIAKQSGLKFK
jgi:Predicted periplasmic or secreted lipoprotein